MKIRLLRGTLYVELLTRITTQPLESGHGDEKTALESVLYSLTSGSTATSTQPIIVSFFYGSEVISVFNIVVGTCALSG